MDNSGSLIEKLNRLVIDEKLRFYTNIYRWDKTGNFLINFSFICLFNGYIIEIERICEKLENPGRLSWPKFELNIYKEGFRQLIRDDENQYDLNILWESIQNSKGYYQSRDYSKYLVDCLLNDMDKI